MFSVRQKQLISDIMEKALLSLKHPEMPKEKPIFALHVNGKELWSFANIEPNWMYEDGHKLINVNPFNESQDNN